MKRRLALEQGVAIVTVLLVLSILAVIGVGIATMGQGNMAVTVAQANSELAYAGAEAAAIYACDVYASALAPDGNPFPATFQVPGPSASPLSAANPNVLINATVIRGGASVTYTPPGSSQPITIPDNNAYVLGCGNVNTNSVQPIRRYVGMMIYKSTPGGVFFFGAYAKNQLGRWTNPSTPSGPPAIDAWDSAMGTIPYDASKRQAYVDVLGAGKKADVSGMSNIWGNVDGPTVVTNAATNFNNYGGVRMPGASLEIPAPPWPSLAPSPAEDLVVDSKSGTVILDASKGDATQWRDVRVEGKGVLILRGPPGQKWQFESLNVNNTGDLLVDGTGGKKTELYVCQDGLTGQLHVGGSATIGMRDFTDPLAPTAVMDTSSLQIYYNGPLFTVHEGTGGTSSVVGSVVCTNPTVSVELFDGGEIFGSVVSNNTISISNDFKLHYDTSLRKPVDPVADPNFMKNFTTKGATIGIISHQRL